MSRPTLKAGMKVKIIAVKVLRITPELLSPPPDLVFLICYIRGLKKEVSRNSSVSDITFWMKGLNNHTDDPWGEREGG